MTKTHKVLIGVLMAMGLLAFFQNCGQSPKNQDSPSDDKVSKLDTSGESSPDDGNMLSQSFDSNDADRNTDVDPAIIERFKKAIKQCERSTGSQRVDCIMQAIQAYYEALANAGYAVTHDNSCFLAYKKIQGLIVRFDSTCRTQLSLSDLYRKDHRHGLSVGECLNMISPNSSDISHAFLFYKGSLNFERVSRRITYNVSGEKHAEVYEFDRNASVFTDSCQKEHRAIPTGVQVDISL